MPSPEVSGGISATNGEKYEVRSLEPVEVVVNSDKLAALESAVRHVSETQADIIDKLTAVLRLLDAREVRGPDDSFHEGGFALWKESKPLTTTTANDRRFPGFHRRRLSNDGPLALAGVDQTTVSSKWSRALTLGRAAAGFRNFARQRATPTVPVTNTPADLSTRTLPTLPRAMSVRSAPERKDRGIEAPAVASPEADEDTEKRIRRRLSRAATIVLPGKETRMAASVHRNSVREAKLTGPALMHMAPDVIAASLHGMPDVSCDSDSAAVAHKGLLMATDEDVARLAAVTDIYKGTSPIGALVHRMRGRFRRGFPVLHPFVVSFDVAYVTIALVSSILATVAVIPQTHADTATNFVEVSYLLHTLITCFTWLWCALRCFVHQQRGTWGILDIPVEIRKRYAVTWMLFDAIYAIPFEWIFAFWCVKTYQWVQVRQLLRLVRIFTILRPANPLAPSRTGFEFLVFMCCCLFSLHMSAVAYAAVEEVGYGQSVYWAVVTMTGVGYGDITPTLGSFWSRFYVMTQCVLGVFVVSTATAYATGFLTQKDKLTERLEEKKQMMHSMLLHYDVPWEVQKTIITLFPAVLDAQSEQEFTGMAEAMPRYIAQKFEGYARAKLLRNVPLFADLEDTAVLLSLSARLEHRWASPQEYIVYTGDPGREMFFLVRGVVDVVVQGVDNVDTVVASLRSGQYFGEIALIEDTVRTASVQAITLCELLVLGRADFECVTKRHPMLHDLFSREVHTRRTQAENQVKTRMRMLETMRSEDSTPDANSTAADSRRTASEQAADLGLMEIHQTHGEGENDADLAIHVHERAANERSTSITMNSTA